MRDELAARFPKIGALMDEGKTEVLAFAIFPRSHWTKIWFTNPLERIYPEINGEPASCPSFPTTPPSSA